MSLSSRPRDARSHRRHSVVRARAPAVFISAEAESPLPDRRPRAGARRSCIPEAVSSLHAFGSSSLGFPEVHLYLGPPPLPLPQATPQRNDKPGINTKNSHSSWHPGLCLNLLWFQKRNTKIKKVQIWVTYILGRREGGERSLIYRSRKMRFQRSDFERVTKNTAVGALLE